MTAERRRPGRPAVGPMTALRLPADLRERLDAATRPGESMAEAARRLLAVALDPVLPDALALAAQVWDRLREGCPGCDDVTGERCEAHAPAAELAGDCRTLAAALPVRPSCRFCGRPLDDDGQCPAWCDDYPPERAERQAADDDAERRAAGLAMSADGARSIPRDCDGCDWTRHAGDGARFVLTRIDPGCPVHGSELSGPERAAGGAR